MAITFSNRIGKVRTRLAKKLSERFPEYHFEPVDLWSQNPHYASAHWDCCSWGATGYLVTDPKLSKDVHSWHTMRSFLKKGIEIEIVGNDENELNVELVPVLKQPLESASAVDTLPLRSKETQSPCELG